MTFLLSKLGDEVLRPSVMLLLLAWIGLILSYHRGSRWGRRLLTVGLVGYLLIFLLPVDSWALLPLEDRFPRPTEPLRVDEIIVLSGAIEAELSRDRGIPSLNSNAERMTAAVALAHRHPEARVLFTGASSAVIPGGPTETEGARQLFASLGLDPTHIIFEDRARNTHENALNSWHLVQPAPAGCWLLITSARHEPRAVGVFREVGWDVTAWPVGYKSGHSLRAWLAPSLSQRFVNLDSAAHEWIGLLAYRLIGWTGTLFPTVQDRQERSDPCDQVHVG